MRAIKKNKRKREHEQAIPEGWEPSEDPIAELAERSATTDALKTALADLPEKHRIAVALRYVHDLSEMEIAMAMRTRPGTVASYLSRARSTLRRNLEVQTSTPELALKGALA
jgi:RNA polymerase sigma-70 factor (ECF subfamily)